MSAAVAPQPLTHAAAPPALPPPVRPTTYGSDPSEYRFSKAQYRRMIDLGVLGPDDPVELLENYLVLKMPRNPPHDGSIDLAGEALRPRLPAGWFARCQQTVDLPDSDPEPDFAIVRGTARSYLTRHPSVADVGLLIEVADSSRDRDLTDKARIYARAGVPVYWVVNIPDKRVEVHTDPSGSTPTPAYATITRYADGDLVPLVLDGATVAHISAADLLP
jgi:Uma2 family endonuclease